MKVLMFIELKNDLALEMDCSWSNNTRRADCGSKSGMWANNATNRVHGANKAAQRAECGQIMQRTEFMVLIKRLIERNVGK
jgi:hypothetical protein